MHILIGPKSGDHVSIEVLRRERAGESDYWDGNWLETIVEVRAGAWAGKFPAHLRSDEFQAFRQEVARLYDRLEGTAEFSPIEPWLMVRLVGNGRGGIAVEGEACDKIGTGNTLQFRGEIDQTYLPQLLKELDEVLRTFPVVGAKEANN